MGPRVAVPLLAHSTQPIPGSISPCPLPRLPRTQCCRWERAASPWAASVQPSERSGRCQVSPWFSFPCFILAEPNEGVQPCQPRRCREETPFPKCQTVEVRQCRTSPPGKRGLGCSVGSSQLPKTFSCQMNTTHAITHAGRGQPPALPTPRAPCAHLHGIRAAHAMGLHGRGFSMATFTQQQSPHFHGEYLISSKLAVLSTCCPSSLELAPTCIYFTLNVCFSAAITSLPVGFWLAFFPSLTFSFRLPFFFQCKWKIHQRTPAMNSPFPMGKAALS